MRVKFSYADRRLSLPNKTNLKIAVDRLFDQEGVKLNTLNYIFCSDEFLLGINRQFLQHDDYTDIITFDLSEDRESEGVTGEIYISVDRVRENAIALGEGFEREMRRVLFHGALHLCGYGDKSATEQVIMRGKEEYYLNQTL